FLHPSAMKVLDRLTNNYCNLRWQKRKCIVQTLDHHKYYLWTFAGSKINRTLVLLAEGLGVSTIKSDYQKVELKFGEANPDLLKLTQDLLAHKDMTVQNVINKIDIPVKKVHFSKFNECLPASLSYEALLSKSFDIKGTLIFLSDLQFEFING
ncbi:MAG: hypothetical protein J7497_14900, partial [Chitinophagaceae bacterium]|nr:hypothetical protein [Chitinophagaceae bacterium]